MTRTKEIAERLAEATTGPWAVNPARAVVDAFTTGEPLPVCQLLWPTDERSEDETLANAALIANAPADLEYLLDITAEQEALQAEQDRFARELNERNADLLAKNKRLRECLNHSRSCQVCADGDWSDCEAGREGLELLGANHD